MQDYCTLLPPASAGADRFNRDRTLHADGTETRCGFDPGGTPREMMGVADVSMRMPVIRLPHGTEVNSRYRIKLTHRHGAELSIPLYFDVIGTPRIGPSAIRVNCRNVSTGSPTYR
jgi:hypothetical protein